MIRRPYGIIYVTGTDRVGKDDDLVQRTRRVEQPESQHPDR